MTEKSLEEFLKSAKDNQKDLLYKLVEVAKKEDELCNRINQVYDSIKSGVYSPDGIGITVCEDEDDAKIISAKDREELERVRGMMKGYMIEAVNIGMSNLGIIQRNYKEYVGREIPNS
jgi:hypothetical protein